MKVIAFNGSPRKGGNTEKAIKLVFEELEKEGIETKLMQIGGKKLYGCLACRKCFEMQNNRCVRTDDDINLYLEKMQEADGIIIGSPTYFSNVTTETKALIDRCGYVNRANGGGVLRGKVGAPVVSARRAGSNFTYAAINFFFGIAEMIIPGSSYWNFAQTQAPEGIEKDEEGIRTFRTLGKNMAALLKKM